MKLLLYLYIEAETLKMFFNIFAFSSVGKGEVQIEHIFLQSQLLRLCYRNSSNLQPRLYGN